MEDWNIDFELGFEEVFPSFVTLVQFSRSEWRSINKILNKDFNNRRRFFQNKPKGFIKIKEMSLIDILSQHQKGDPDVTGQVEFMNDLFIDLSKIVSENERAMIKSSVYNFITQPNRSYKNYLGELGILHRFLLSGYKLINTEELLDESNPESTTLDFTFTKDNKIFYVEVMNLHLNENKTTERIDLERLLNQIKVKRNLKGLSDSKRYWIYPVMWGQHDELKRVNEYVKENDISFVNTFPIVSFMWYGDPDDETKSMYRFGNIEKLVEPIPLTE